MDVGVASHAEFEEECQRCHGGWIGVSPSLCLECHADTDFERETGTGIHGRLTNSGRCTTCHTDHNGVASEMTTFDIKGFQHGSLTGFSLVHHRVDYENQPLLCSDCHTPGRYLVETVDCTACHTSDDQDFIQSHTSLFGTACLDCHDGLDSMSTFEHNEVFALDGAHKDLSCDTCHSQSLISAEIRICVDCHQEPDLHFGQFGTDCVRCHSTSAWTPAQLSQHVFPLDHGDSGKVDCLTCHEDSYTEYTCYGCHEHEQQDLLEEHLDEGITEFDDCVDCHPRGLEDEAQALTVSLALGRSIRDIDQR